MGGEFEMGGSLVEMGGSLDEMGVCEDWGSSSDSRLSVFALAMDDLMEVAHDVESGSRRSSE